MQLRHPAARDAPAAVEAGAALRRDVRRLQRAEARDDGAVGQRTRGGQCEGLRKWFWDGGFQAPFPSAVARGLLLITLAAAIE